MAHDLISSLPVRAGEPVADAFVKLKLAHAEGFSVVLPDVIAVPGTGFFAPKYFAAPLLSFVESDGYIQLFVETQHGAEITVATTKGRYIRSFGDGSALYKCRIAGVLGKASGQCKVDSDSRIRLRLFHHTSADSLEKIQASKVVHGSAWNVQGTRKLANVSYAYFTSLAQIESEADLVEIAMASDERLHLLPTRGQVPDDIVEIKVYRGSTSNRTHTLGLDIPSDLLASPHLWFHAPLDGPAYYEVNRPSIFRVPLKPKTSAPFENGTLKDTDAVKHLRYIVLGDASTKDGLAAPFDEEGTESIFKIEPLAQTDLFDTWRQFANTDRFTGQHVERAEFR